MYNRNFLLTTTLLVLCLTCAGKLSAQHQAAPQRKFPSWLPHPPQHEARPQRPRRTFRHIGYPNVITGNFPTFMYIGGYPGISVGAEYERFIDRDGMLSATLSMHRYWAGTNASGELRTGETRANIQGSFFAPGFFYHPAGNRGRVDIAIGAVIPVGSLRRYDVSGLNSSYNSYTDRTFNTLAAMLFQANMTVHSAGHFVFTTYVSVGPMLSAGITRGAMGQIGLKFGGRF